MAISNINGVAATTASSIFGLTGFSKINGFDLAGGGGGGTTATDSFNRANADPISNPMSDGVSTWQSGNSTAVNDLQIQSNRAIPVSGLSVKRVGSPTFASDQEAVITMPSSPASAIIGPAVRIQGDTNASCYVAICDNGNTIIIYRLADTGSLGFTSLNSSGAVLTLLEGDLISITAEGTTITAYQNGVQRAQAIDATLSGGQPGVFSNGSPIDAFSASNL